jgi:hypothetical protein
LLLFCPVSEVATSRAENNTRLGNTFFITSMYLGYIAKQRQVYNGFDVFFLGVRRTWIHYQCPESFFYELTQLPAGSDNLYIYQ